MVGTALCHLLDEQFSEARNLLDLVQQVCLCLCGSHSLPLQSTVKHYESTVEHIAIFYSTRLVSSICNT